VTRVLDDSRWRPLPAGTLMLVSGGVTRMKNGPDLGRSPVGDTDVPLICWTMLKTRERSIGPTSFRRGVPAVVHPEARSNSA
jgi:hypothetical protein